MLQPSHPYCIEEEEEEEERNCNEGVSPRDSSFKQLSQGTHILLLIFY